MSLVLYISFKESLFSEKAKNIILSVNYGRKSQYACEKAFLSLFQMHSDKGDNDGDLNTLIKSLQSNGNF